MNLQTKNVLEINEKGFTFSLWPWAESTAPSPLAWPSQPLLHFSLNRLLRSNQRVSPSLPQPNMLGPTSSHRHPRDRSLRWVQAKPKTEGFSPFWIISNQIDFESI
jgi:hypothetical protein